jgi:uncharacterized membrane protein
MLAAFVMAAGLVACGGALAQVAPSPAASPPPAASPAPAEGPSPAAETLSGLWLTTAFPELTLHVGDKIELGLTLQNHNRPPARVALAVEGLPEGWAAEIDGGGNPVTAATVNPDDKASLTLKLTPPDGVKTGTYPFQVTGTADGETLSLPIELTLAAPAPARLTLDPKLPALRGSARSSFDFELTIKNESPGDVTVNLLSQEPAGFQTTFTEQYGTQELTSLPLKAGESKEVKASVKPPQDSPAGQYQVAVGIAGGDMTAEAPLLVDITGQPQLSFEGPDGRLSGDAVAGAERSFQFTLHNTGSASAENVHFTGSAPSGWKVAFDPAQIADFPAGQETPVNVTITPSDKAIAGDYVAGLTAAGDGASDRADFRVTVTTSTMWGVIGLIIIGAAVIVLAIAVARYGRR